MWLRRRRPHEICYKQWMCRECADADRFGCWRPRITHRGRSRGDQAENWAKRELTGFVCFLCLLCCGRCASILCRCCRRCLVRLLLNAGLRHQLADRLLQIVDASCDTHQKKSNTEQSDWSARSLSWRARSKPRAREACCGGKAELASHLPSRRLRKGGRNGQQEEKGHQHAHVSVALARFSPSACPLR